MPHPPKSGKLKIERSIAHDTCTVVSDSAVFFCDVAAVLICCQNFRRHSESPMNGPTRGQHSDQLRPCPVDNSVRKKSALPKPTDQKHHLRMPATHSCPTPYTVYLKQKVVRRLSTGEVCNNSSETSCSRITTNARSLIILSFSATECVKTKISEDCCVKEETSDPLCEGVQETESSFSCWQFEGICATCD